MYCGDEKSEDMLMAAAGLAAVTDLKVGKTHDVCSCGDAAKLHVEVTGH